MHPDSDPPLHARSELRPRAGGAGAPVDLSALIARVLGRQRSALDAAGIEVRLDLDPALSPVTGEAEALQQMLLSLVARARSELASWPGPRRLIARTRESSEGVLLSVVDNGPGIARSRLPHLFDPPEESSGAEVPLWIAATIVREHGGRIVAESEEGHGTAFLVRLPRAAAPAPAPAPRDEAEPQPEQRAARALRVLVADDEPTLRLVIALLLGRRGHHVVQATDAHEALRLAQEEPFDVALVDAYMPGDGLQLLERLEAMPTLRGRTALMTGDADRARSHRGAGGARAALVKPFDVAEAVRLVEQLGG
ncbi:MAG TPA: hybrid sensor histidine kinase/response regulator [Longimicrobiaceae bacterium]|nr:hybrid sensor histidine kinase/response regulator [Longimicrobiaceae bacterium]